MQQKVKVITEEQELLNEMLRDDLETMQISIPPLENVMDEDIREDLPGMIQDKAGFKEDFDLQLDMMIDLFSADSVEEMASRADALLTKTKERAVENQQIILETIRPWERTLRSINLFFQNAAVGGKVEHAQFVAVDPEKFAGATNPVHFTTLAEKLKDLFYAWIPEDSPMYLSYAGDIKDGANAMAKIAEETMALAVVDTVESNSAEATLRRTKERNLGGSESEWGHLAVSGTYLIGRGAHPDLESKPLSVPSSPAIAGKLMGGELGGSIAGFEHGALAGAKGVAYQSGTRESKKFGDRGMLIIGWEEGTARIFGDTTANKSDNKLLRKVSKMNVHNKVMNDVIAFCNRKAFSKWGKSEQRKFINQLQNYLNDLVRDKVIQGYTEIKIEENSNNDEEVSVSLGLEFYNTINRYMIKVEEGNVDSFQRI